MTDRRHKNNRNRFSVSIIGIVLYSVILVSVMAIAYMGVKSLIRGYEAGSIEANDAVIEEAAEDIPEEDIAEEVEETVDSEEAEEVIETDDSEAYEHLTAITEIVDAANKEINYSNTIFEPGQREEGLKWKDTVFSAIENVSDPQNAVVNTYDFVRLNEKLAGNKPVEYRVYTAPDGYIAKITEVVETGGSSQLYDYYYDKGNINYIAQYGMQIEKPVVLTSTDIESRYYFDKDVLVRYIYCHDGKATEYSLADIDSYSTGTVDQYNYLESDMINRAYIVYNIGKSMKAERQICGYVLDECSAPISDALVTITNDSTGVVAANINTNGDGYYSVIIDADDNTSFTVSANIDGVEGSSVYGVTALSQAGKFCVAPLYLGYDSSNEELSTQIYVGDAHDISKTLEGAEVKIRTGINNKDGKTISSGKIDASGNFVTALHTGSYTAEVTKEGYETAYIPVIVKSDRQAAVGFMVEKTNDNSYQCVLTWQKSPLDLDCKAISSDQGRVIRASLDSVGLTNAETVIIDNAGTDTYRLYVEDLDSINNNNNMSYAMSEAEAYVTVYGPEGFAGNFQVPAASAGIIWDAIQIYGGKVLPINKYYHGVEDNAIWHK